MNDQRNDARYSIVLLGLVLTLAASAPADRGQVSAPKGNGKIAFVAGGISTMNPDGSGRTQLTSSSTFQKDEDPAWSPDGTQIAFARHVLTQPASNYFALVDVEIWVMNADGSNQHALTHSRYDFGPTWSPDGRKIAFSGSCLGCFQWALYVMNADGSDQRIISQNINGWNWPNWSPDGSKLAVVSSAGIYLVNTDGSNQTLLAQFDPEAWYWTRPSWSPDGSKIAVITQADCVPFIECYSSYILTVSADGSKLQKLADLSFGYGVCWSPDGTKIVFSDNSDLFVMNPDGSGITDITNTPNVYESEPSWQPVELAPPPNGNPIDDPQFFVRQQYLDFLSREPDPNGLAFWTNEIASCGMDQQCVEVKRINVSAAYFLSIEFQQTGYLVYRINKAAYGNLPDAPVPVKFNEFLSDAQEIGQGVVVGQTGWEMLLENNKQAFIKEFVNRPRFTSAYPQSMTPAEFVDKLNANGGNTLTPTERDHLVSDLETGAKTRAAVLRIVAENEQITKQEFNRAFVLMQYFGYLRRNPNDAPDSNFNGYNFWLNKLNSFNSDFAQAEMVKAFIAADEYRRRFGP